MRNRQKIRINRGVIEALEARRLLSASLVDPVAQPIIDFSPLEGTLADGSSSPSAYSPSQIRSVYGINSIKLNGIVGNGSGQTIAIVVAYDDPSLVSSTSPGFSTSDLHIFDAEFGIADPPSFTKVEQFAGGSYPSADTGWSAEASLDVEWSHAIAPDAKIVLMEAKTANSSNLLSWGVTTAAQTAGVSVISMSFGFSEFQQEQSFDSIFTTPSGHTPITFVASTGDDGDPGNYPAFSPNVVAVGGTTLPSGTTLSSETGYDGSGGGVSEFEFKPSYESKVTLSATRRTIPDVSFDGDPNTGVSVYDSYNGGYANKWYKVGGTSLSAPAWAGLIATADQGRAVEKLATLDGSTDTLAKLYSAPASDFHDITSGSNGDFSGPGYDLVTGRGSPIANLLEPDLAGISATTIATATIAGTAYVDANGNGKFDSGEKVLSDVNFYFDTNKNGVMDGTEPFATTNSGGLFSFGSLPAGTYRVREVVPANYKLTTPSSGYFDVTVQVGWHITGTNFANISTIVVPPHYIDSVSGYVFFDANKNGKFDSTEKALTGITVFIDTNKDGKLDDGEEYTTTNATGYYYLGLITAGTFRVRESIPTGYKLTTPAVGYYDVPLKGGWNVKNENWGNLT